MTCEWVRCRRRATHEATWPSGKRGLYCFDHGRGVAFAHDPDVLPDLNAEQTAGVMAAVLRFKENTQRRIDRGTGLSRVSIRFGDDPEITVAEKRHSEPLP